jgi:hypothetical protein
VRYERCNQPLSAGAAPAASLCDISDRKHHAAYNQYGCFCNSRWNCPHCPYLGLPLCSHRCCACHRLGRCAAGNPPSTAEFAGPGASTHPPTHTHTLFLSIRMLLLTQHLALPVV